MTEFYPEHIDMFLGVVRKYMQVRGPMSQKELAENIQVGVSTMSRFLNQKTTEINPQLIARIIAFLNVPLYEVVDFVHEEHMEKFKRLVQFYKADFENENAEPAPIEDAGNIDQGESEKNVTAKIKVGGKEQSIHFGADTDPKVGPVSIREKLESLTPRQKTFMNDFLNLSMEERDVFVDIGISLLRYFRQKGYES